MNVGDRVKMSPMWKYESATGKIKKITKDGYVVVVWDNINGEWWWTEDQAKNLEVIDEDN